MIEKFLVGSVPYHYNKHIEEGKRKIVYEKDKTFLGAAICTGGYI